MTERGLDHVVELEDLADELLEVDGDEGGMIVPLMAAAAAAAAVAIGVLALLIRRREVAKTRRKVRAVEIVAAPPATSGLALGTGQRSYLGLVLEATESEPDPRASWSVDLQVGD